jgi:tetratricopeptide (TPR) repeat protein
VAVERARAALRASAAAWAMSNAREAISRKDLSEAEKWLHDLIEKLPDTPEAAEARSMIAGYHDRVRAERTAAADREHQEVLEKGLANGKKAYADMLEANKAALQDGRGGSRAVKLWEKGVREGEKALRELDRFQKRNPEGHGDLLDTYRAAVNEQLVEIHLHLATHWATRNSYNKALAHCNQALALDGDSEEAKHLRNRIIDASSRNARWIW